jgi:hypothetical protein
MRVPAECLSKMRRNSSSSLLLVEVVDVGTGVPFLKTGGDDAPPPPKLIEIGAPASTTKLWVDGQPPITLDRIR